METDGANQRRQQQQQPQQQNQQQNQQNQQNQPQQQQQPQNQQTLLPQNPLQQHQMEAENQQPTIEAMDTQDGDVVNESSIVMESLVNNEDANMQIAPQVDSTTMGMDATTTEPCVEEEVRSEATFQFEVENFSKLKESLLSPPCYVRKLPWKIMVMPRSDRSHPETKSLGFFLQCNAESESNSWSCNAVAELRLKSFKPDQEPFIRKIKHLFYSKENDWGFSYFMSWNEILDPEKGYVQNDKIVLEVHVTAEAPHGVFWDSKKHTGYVGLKNQGATCYMNSLLQTLYFTNQLRKAVYKMPTEADDSSKSVALALQRVFHELQFSDKPVGTKKLTKSFGWETLDSFMQHDVQEFLRVLLDKLESKMKGTCVEGTVPNLFEGKMTSYIKCKDVNYSSSRSETFYDIQLNIKGKKNISDSFADYIEPETLEGDNKYDAGDYGLQEAEKGVIFQSFPPVLHLHLMRFQYDPITDNSVKFNDRFEFDEEIELDKFLAKPEETEAKYRLHAVLVHSGDNHGGHYVVYINPLGDGKWCKFDDDVVSSCSKKEAIEQNYGGVEDDMSLNAKHCSNAYMLVYIRVSEMDEVLQKIEESDIPKELTERLHEEKRMETIRRRERAEASSYVLVHVVLEECLETHHSTDLFDLEKAHVRVFKMKKTETFGDLVATLEKSFRVPENRMRVWPLLLKGNVSRPIYFDNKDEYSQPLGNLVDPQTPWTVFLELAPPDTKEPLPPFDQKRDILLFFKFYDPYVKRLGYIGFGQFLLTQKFFELVPYINERLGFPLETELTIYEETGPSLVNKVNPNETLGSNLKGTREEVQGNILIFEKKHYDEKEEFELPTCDDYFRDLLYRIEVTFLDKCNPNDPGFILELSHRNTYDQMAQAVAQRIDTDPNKIQFFKSLGYAYKDLPGNPLRSVYEGSLKDILAYNKPRTGKKIFYQRLSMNLNELEDKKQYKCLWVSPNFKEEKELVLYPNKNGTVKTLLEEAAKQIPFAEDSTGKLRLVEVASHKLLQSFREDTALEHIVSNPESIATNQASPKFYRIEEIPASELGLTENEMLIPVCHFSKEIYNAFGIPFFIKAKYGEPFGALKERIRKRLNVPEKEWEKYKFAIITNRAEFISDDTIPVSLDSFRPNQPGNNPLPCLGLEHMNKSQKRSRYTYLEKAIKIYN